MNKARRKRLGEVFDLIKKCEEIIQEVLDEENESLENLPDSFRYGEKGEEIEGYIEMPDRTIKTLTLAEMEAQLEADAEARI